MPHYYVIFDDLKCYFKILNTGEESFGILGTLFFIDQQVQIDYVDDDTTIYRFNST